MMEKQPSLESKNHWKKCLQASSSPSVGRSALQPQGTGENLVVVPTGPTSLPAAASASPSASENDEYEVFKEDEYDMNDIMLESEPSNDLSIDQRGVKPTRRGKRKKGIPVSPKAKARKRGRAKRADCWKHFKVVNAVSKAEPGKTVEKAKCNYCKSLFAYSQGGQTSSLNRHLQKCSPFLNSAGRQLAQGRRC